MTSQESAVSAAEPSGDSLRTLPLWGCIVLSLLLAATRLVHLGADTPPDFVRASYGPYVDEGYKTSAARNEVLFGASRWNEFDDGDDWSRISPVTTAAFGASFRLFGVKLTSARLASVAWFLILLLSVALALRRRYPAPLLVLVLVGMAFEAQIVTFSRIALLVLPLMLFATLPQLALARERFRHPLVFGALAAICLGVGTVGVKIQAPAYAVGALVAFALWWWFKEARDQRLGVALAGVALVLAAAAAYGARGAFAERLIFFDPLSSAWDLRFATINAMHLPSAFALAGAFFAVAHIVLVDREAFRDPYFCSLVGTMVIGPFVIGVFAYDPLRYYSPLFPAFLLVLGEWARRKPWKNQVAECGPAVAMAAALLIAQGTLSGLQALNLQVLERVPLNLGQDPGLADDSAFLLFGVIGLVVGIFGAARRDLAARALPLLIGASLVGATLVSAHFLSRIVLTPSYAASELAERIQAVVPSGSSVGGDWAPFLLLESDRPTLHMSNYRNRFVRVRELDVDYYLYSDTPLVGRPVWEELQTQDFGIELGEPLVRGEYVGREVRLYRLEYRD